MRWDIRNHFLFKFWKVNFKLLYLVSSKIEKFNLKLSINTWNKKRAQEFIWFWINIQNSRLYEGKSWKIWLYLILKCNIFNLFVFLSVFITFLPSNLNKIHLLLKTNSSFIKTTTLNIYIKIKYFNISK